MLDEAIAELREAIGINKGFAEAHNNLGNVLAAKGRTDEAIAELREALRLRKNKPGYHSNLGLALQDKGLVDEAIAEYREALRINMDYPTAHYNLGNALRDKGLLDEAIAEYRPKSAGPRASGHPVSGREKGLDGASRPERARAWSEHRLSRVAA